MQYAHFSQDVFSPTVKCTSLAQLPPAQVCLLVNNFFDIELLFANCQKFAAHSKAVLIGFVNDQRIDGLIPFNPIIIHCSARYVCVILWNSHRIL